MNRHRLFLPLGALALLLARDTHAQNAIVAPVWPAVTAEMRPWTRWWWQGSAVNKADLSANLDQYRRAGLGGVEVTPIYGVKGAESENIPYLSPRWVEMLEHTVAESKRLGLGVDIANGTGWPFGGPSVGDADAAKYVARKAFTLRGGERLKDSVVFMQPPLVRAVTGPVSIAALRDPIATTPDLATLAIDQARFPKPLPLQTLMAYSARGDVVDLTARVDRAGVLNWTAPAGEWTLYALFQGWHGKQVERAAPGGEGNVIDHFAVQPTSRYLARFDDAFRGRAVTGVRAYFNDSYEVDDASGQGDWAHRRKGIIRNQAHGSPANILDLYAASDIPETEGTEPTRIKFATSAAHVSGKRLASAEAATWLGEHFLSRLSDVRTVLDNYFLGGVNHVFYHGTAYSPASEPWPGRLFYAAVEFNPQNSWWQDFGELNAYATRVQSFMQSGAPDNDVLLYFPIHDRFAQRPVARGRAGQAPPATLLDHFDAIPVFDSSAFRFATDSMIARGYAFDYVSDRQLLRVRGRGAELTTGNARYRTVLVPESQFIPLETFEHLLRLARAGAAVAFYRGLPGDVNGLHQLDERRAKFRALAAGLRFAPVGTTTLRRAVVGEGAILLGDDLGALLDAAGARRERATDMGLALIRRRETNGTTYFIVNRVTASVDGWVPLATPARSAAVYAPMHAASGMGRVRDGASGAEVYLQFPVGASRIVRTYDTVVRGAPWPYVEPAEPPRALAGSWTLTFLSGGPTLPAEVRNVSLGSWTSLRGDDVKNFSGTARYAIDFPRPASPTGTTSWRLDLGTVHESARVTLNGLDMGTYIGPWFRVDLPADAMRDGNHLEVFVSNLMANRVVDLDRRGVVWKKFCNINFPARLGTNRGADGLFSAAKWAPLPSGLVGPVTLTPLRASGWGQSRGQSRGLF